MKSIERLPGVQAVVISPSAWPWVNALADLGLSPDQVTMFTGIGQAAKMVHYIRVNGFNGLHGRALPAAIGMVVCQSRDEGYC